EFFALFFLSVTSLINFVACKRLLSHVKPGPENHQSRNDLADIPVNLTRMLGTVTQERGQGVYLHRLQNIQIHATFPKISTYSMHSFRQHPLGLPLDELVRKRRARQLSEGWSVFSFHSFPDSAEHGASLFPGGKQCTG